MSRFTGNIGPEEEDGLGWDGLVESREERIEAKLRARIKELESFVRDVASNWDCDQDGHRYNTGCRCCKAMELLSK